MQRPKKAKREGDGRRNPTSGMMTASSRSSGPFLLQHYFTKRSGGGPKTTEVTWSQYLIHKTFIHYHYPLFWCLSAWFRLKLPWAYRHICAKNKGLDKGRQSCEVCLDASITIAEAEVDWQQSQSMLMMHHPALLTTNIQPSCSNSLPRTIIILANATIFLMLTLSCRLVHQKALDKSDCLYINPN